MHRSTSSNFRAQGIGDKRVLSFSNRAIVIVIERDFTLVIRLFSATKLGELGWFNSAHCVVHFPEKTWHQWIRSRVIRLLAHVSPDLFVRLFFSLAKRELEKLVCASLLSSLLLKYVF